MKSKPLIFILFILITQFIFSQKCEIKNIKINDSILSIVLKEFITNHKNSAFKIKGYLEVRPLYNNDQAIDKELKAVYRIKVQYYNLDIEKDQFPLFYGYFDSKLFLWYAPKKSQLNLNICEKSKKKLLKKLKPYLNKSEHIIAKDSNGNVIIDDKNFTDDIYNIHGGITLKIYNDDSFVIE